MPRRKYHIIEPDEDTMTQEEAMERVTDLVIKPIIRKKYKLRADAPVPRDLVEIDCMYDVIDGRLSIGIESYCRNSFDRMLHLSEQRFDNTDMESEYQDTVGRISAARDDIIRRWPNICDADCRRGLHTRGCILRAAVVIAIPDLNILEDFRSRRQQIVACLRAGARHPNVTIHQKYRNWAVYLIPDIHEME
jgi:hypothetical protein